MARKVLARGGIADAYAAGAAMPPPADPRIFLFVGGGLGHHQ